MIVIYAALIAKLKVVHSIYFQTVDLINVNIWNPNEFRKGRNKKISLQPIYSFSKIESNDSQLAK